MSTASVRGCTAFLPFADLMVWHRPGIAVGFCLCNVLDPAETGPLD